MAPRITELDVDCVVDQLRTDGIFVAKDFYDDATVNRLNEEFELLLSHQFVGVKENKKRKIGRMFRVNYEKLDIKSLHSFQSAFCLREYREICDRYMDINSIINNDLVATQELGIRGVSDHLIDALTKSHIDVLRALKFMVYLMDTNEENGAFCYARGTHAMNTRLRHRHLRCGGSIRALPAVLPADVDLDFESIQGPAGTLIIFDTDGVHRAGRMSEGTERRILRNRCLFPNQPARKPSKYSRQWFWELRLNPMKIFAPKVPEGFVHLQEWHRMRGEQTSGEVWRPKGDASS